MSAPDKPVPRPDKLVAAPAQLVEDGVRHYGRLTDRPVVVNPLDAYAGASRALRRLRLKEWVGFTLTHPDLYCSMIMQDANYLASSEIYAYNVRSGRQYGHAANAAGGSLGLPMALHGSRCSFTRKRYALDYDFSGKTTYRIHVDMAATAKVPAFSGDLELGVPDASPALSVSSRLPGGAMYTHKRIFPASGSIRIGDDEFGFDPGRDFAIIDEHKTFLPYRTTWVWGTFGQLTEDGYVGANFVDRPELPGEAEESGLWTPDEVEALADITFTPASDNPLAPWHIASADGRLDVTFEPEGRKTVRHQLGLFAIDYFQLYGHYRGTIRGATRAYSIEGVHGVCESMRARL